MRKLNHRILYELDLNARSNLSSIAKKWRTSEQLVSYTLKQLLKKKSIKGFVTYFDYSMFGLHAYIVLFRLFYRKKEELDTFVEQVKTHPELARLEILDGKWGIFATFLAPNPSYFNKLLKKIKSDNKKFIRADVIITSVVTYQFPRYFLLDKKNEEDSYFIIGGDRKPVVLDSTLHQIAKCLLENPVMKIKEIHKETGLSFLTISNGIKKLRQQGIIKSFKPNINYEDFLIQAKKIFIRYQDFSLEMEDKLVYFCIHHSNIVNLTKTFGEWDLILTFESVKKSEFNEFMLSLREKYEEIIADYEIMDIVETLEVRFLPKKYFDAPENPQKMQQ